MDNKSIKEWLEKSVEEPDLFWAEVGEKFTWYEKWSDLNKNNPDGAPVWFAGGVTNICANALDRHARGKNRGKAALIRENAETGETKVLTYWHLLSEVNRFAGALKNMGIMPGDRVLIYMPMIPEAAIALLACARVGAVSSTIWAGAGLLPLTERLKNLKPKIVVTSDGFLYRGQKAPMKTTLDSSIEEAELKMSHVVVLDRKLSPWKPVGLRDITWVEAMEQLGEHNVPPVKLDASAPSCIVYTSGATGKPRGFARDTGGAMAALCAAMRASGMNEDDVVLSTSDPGSPQGPDDAIFGPLLIGATSVLYEGLPDYPTPGSWWDTLEKHGATALICPTADFAWLRRFHSKWIASHDLNGLRRIVVYGEPLYDAVRKWAGELIKAPLIEQYRLAEFASPLLTTTPENETTPVPGPGIRLETLDAGGKQAETHALGNLVVQSPFPPGSGVPWNIGAALKRAPADGFDTGDLAQRSAKGEFRIMGRAGEEIHAGEEIYGSRLIEEIIVSNFVVAEAVVVQGDEVAAFVVLKDKVPGTNPLRDEIKKMVSDALGEAATPKKIMFIRALPRTPSGKALRRMIKGILAGKSVGDLSSIRNPDTLPIVKDAIKAARL